jgi:hypothetical protein
MQECLIDLNASQAASRDTLFHVGHDFDQYQARAIGVG